MPTRISGACNGCRAKKQKCSGDRNGCIQCDAAGVACTWPEQRKRGPAKGYIEGLEHRLHEAESLLLQLLPYLSTEQLQAAVLASVDHDGAESGRGSPDRRSSPPSLNKKTGIEYWENFPLTSVNDIQRWQQDCEVHGGNHRDSLVKTENRHASPQRQVSDRSSRTNRCSVQGLSSASNTHFANDENINRDFYMMQTEVPPSRQPIQNQVPISVEGQSQNIWHTPLMHNGSVARSNSHSGIPQQQMFSQINYMQNQHPNSWQTPQGMNIDLNTGLIDPRSSTRRTDQQVHSHLFW